MRIASVLLSVVLLSYLLAFSACDPGCNSEAPFTAYIHLAEGSLYTSVYGLDGTRPGKEIQIYSSYQVEMPLARNQDKTVLIFQSDTRKDTLSIQYVLTPKLQSTKCGFYMDADQYKIVEPTSFSSVELGNYPSPSQINVYIHD